MRPQPQSGFSQKEEQQAHSRCIKVSWELSDPQRKLVYKIKWCVCVHMCVRILLKSALSLSEREPLLKSALRSSDKDISFFLYCYFPFLCSEDLSEPTHFSPYFTQIQHFNGSLWMKSLSYSTVVTGPKILQNQIPPQCYFIIFPEFRTLISVYLSTNI